MMTLDDAARNPETIYTDDEGNVLHDAPELNPHELGWTTYARMLAAREVY